MMIAVLNNLTEIITGSAWTGLVFYAGSRFGTWKTGRKSA